jgi:hypothetical protein
MDTKLLVEQAKLRFAHQIATDYLQNKYQSKLILAEQQGLWKIDINLIAFLESVNTEFVVMIDQYKVPVRVNTQQMLEVCKNRYHTVMDEWYTEYKKLENKR